MSQPFPFSAIVGQEAMKQAMVLTAIDPGIGGVLVFGDRGTGKSTAVSALAALLPEILAVEGCPVNSARIEDVPDWAGAKSGKIVKRPTPVIDLPLGATEDRVVGALDIERALTRGASPHVCGRFWRLLYWPAATRYSFALSACKELRSCHNHFPAARCSRRLASPPLPPPVDWKSPP